LLTTNEGLAVFLNGTKRILDTNPVTTIKTIRELTINIEIGKMESWVVFASPENRWVPK
jgi:hypothetical protein